MNKCSNGLPYSAHFLCFYLILLFSLNSQPMHIFLRDFTKGQLHSSLLFPKSHRSMDLVMTLQKGDACLQQLKKTFKQKPVSVTGQCVNCAALQTLNMTGMFLCGPGGTVLRFQDFSPPSKCCCLVIHRTIKSHVTVF